ncbi:MAG: YqgE/AlgH family protein [Dehalococcoidia bacterium]|nr:YqgE/AlgH family protein [Dehalococcoidia bacterium]
MQESTAGRLLIATPLLTDPNFERTVILVCFHDGNGAFGIVLNRPVGSPAGDLLPEWSELLTPPGELHYGGPVERSSFLGLGYIEGPEDHGLEWWTPIARGVGLVNLAADIEEAESLEALRVYHGYAGWGAGQLDAEIGENSWFVVDVDPEDPFTERPERLWNEVLGRQRGELSMYGTYPLDHRVN